MAIITMAHHNSLLGNYDGEYTYPNTPAQNGNITTSFTDFKPYVNKFYTKTNNGTVTGRLAAVNTSGWIPSIGAIDYSTNPDKKEFWIRRCTLIQPGSEGNFDNIHLGYFYVTGGDGKLVRSLQIFFDGSSSLAFRILAADGTTVVSTGVIATRDKWCKVNADRECFVDIRINIDPVAGFIQCYDTAGNLAGEYLGPTHGAVKPTHIGLTTIMYNPNNNWDYYYYVGWYTPFAIAADEATFGMFVTPLLGKANGRKQEQSTGDYTKHQYLVPVPRRANAVTVLLDSADPKQYTVSLQSMAEASIPDTHEIKAFQMAALFDVEVGIPAKVETALTICDAAGNFVIDPKKEVAANAQSDLNLNYQRHWSKLHNVSPFTGTGWTKAELAGVEIGFTVYPPITLV